ncbi:MAG: matrixin family metalloprotease, partial [Nanoarchaeota archaeon]
MKLKIILGFLFSMFIIFILFFYWFVPFKTITFEYEPEHSNFNLNQSLENMQFYQNMRYPNSKISYRIYDCPLQKKNDMQRAFDILENKTILDFYSVLKEEEISVTCDSNTKMEGNLFIAGEGGPTNVTLAGDFYVITHGTILLIRDSKCSNPNIAIHELLHTLGFEHSENRKNIMYPISNCEQEIGEDTIALINEIYKIPSKPDLICENVSAEINGRYLDASFNVKNNGLKDSMQSELVIYGDDEIIDKIEIGSLKIGYGNQIEFKNLWVQRDIKELEFVINYN